MFWGGFDYDTRSPHLPLAYCHLNQIQPTPALLTHRLSSLLEAPLVVLGEHRPLKA